MPTDSRAAPSRVSGARRLAIAAFCGVVAVAAVAALAAPGASRLEKSGALYRYEHVGEAYVFDAAWRTEALWRQSPGAGAWQRVADPDPVHVDLLRQAFLHRLGRASVLDIPSEGAEEMRTLRALGYL